MLKRVAMEQKVKHINQNIIWSFMETVGTRVHIFGTYIRERTWREEVCQHLKYRIDRLQSIEP